MGNWLYVFSGGLGLIIGSFLNTVIYRYNTGRTVGGRSQCLSCGATLAWNNLLPIASFLFQRGRCATCRSRISFQYPLVEFAAGALFALTAGKFFPPPATLLSWPALAWPLALTIVTWIIMSLFIVITVYDLRHKIIPDHLVYAFIFFGAIYALTEVVRSGASLGSLRFNLLAGLLFFSVFGGLWFFSGGRWMGFGDAKLVLGLGLWLGLWPGLTALILGFWLGAGVGLALVLLSRSRYFTMKSEIPFAPFLVAGALLTFFFNLNVIPF